MYQGKIVLITGSSRGVGLEITKHFIENHATVLGISKGSSSFEHENYHHFSLDIGEPEMITLCFRKEIGKQFKRIDIVINNAAVMTSQYSMIMPIKNAVDMVNVNLLGVFFISREAAKLMRTKEPGRIINIGSMASSLEPIGDSLYAATKAGISSLANILAKELSSMNITCNTLAITAIETDMLNSHSATAQLKIKEIINSLPIPRMAAVDDIINVIDFFASDRSSYITAQTIYLGGIN
ncbi:MAG TPA: SDR family oxidoreductase [Saprospiraceae bacterium]|nr:SDR family oxidoreductase [Saprospiraceae bacterium]